MVLRTERQFEPRRHKGHQEEFPHRVIKEGLGMGQRKHSEIRSFLNEFIKRKNLRNFQCYKEEDVDESLCNYMENFQNCLEKNVFEAQEELEKINGKSLTRNQMVFIWCRLHEVLWRE